MNRRKIHPSTIKMMEDAIKQKKEAESQIMHHVSPFVSQIKNLHDSIKSIKTTSHELMTPTSFSLESRPATVRDIKMLLNKKDESVPNDIKPHKGNIFFNSSDSELKHHVGPNTYTHKFTKGKGYPLIDTLTSSKSYISTEDLRDILECPTKEALYRLINTTNNKITNNLKIDEKIIESREGLGYRISNKIKIYRE